MVTLLGTQAAAGVLARLEGGPSPADVLRAVRRTLGRLERDPFDPRLRTRQFSTESRHQMRVTPVPVGDWHIYWIAGPGPDEITIVFIADPSP